MRTQLIRSTMNSSDTINTELEASFARLFGCEARPYQLRVASHLLNGRSVILRAPTGYGKTFASVFPFLHARSYNLDFPTQMLYSLPLRVLASSLASTVRLLNTGCVVRMQTGEAPEDPQLLEGDAIFS